jgi:hypothetical protein
MHYAETQYGFEYGSVKVSRMFSSDAKGWVTLGIETPKHSGPYGLQVHVTRTGEVRIIDSNGEWVPPNAKVEKEEMT